MSRLPVPELAPGVWSFLASLRALANMPETELAELEGERLKRDVEQPVGHGDELRA